MSSLVVLSDIHYAGPAEAARGSRESSAISNPLLRVAVKLFRDYIWLRNPTGQNGLLDEFFSLAGTPDLVVSNGDYSCDSGFVGVTHPAAFESAFICLTKLRKQFGQQFEPVQGDHEIGKLSLFGGNGGLRFESFRRTVEDLGVSPTWTRRLGKYVLIGVPSTVLAFPVFQSESLPNEVERWTGVRRRILNELSETLAGLGSKERIIFFCHDPTAIPFLAEIPAVQQRLDQIEATIIGHLHSPLVFWKSRMLAGMPAIHFLGNSVRRYSSALNRGKCWKVFKVTLCPSLAGIELLKDGGFLKLDLDQTINGCATIQKVSIKR